VDLVIGMCVEEKNGNIGVGRRKLKCIEKEMNDVAGSTVNLFRILTKLKFSLKRITESSQ
jgi:hypothetical protein